MLAISIGIWYLGHYGETNCNNTEKTKQLRQTIEAMSKQGSSVKDIAEALGTHRDTIYREFKRCGATLETYTAAAGQQAL